MNNSDLMLTIKSWCTCWWNIDTNKTSRVCVLVLLCWGVASIFLMPVPCAYVCLKIHRYIKSMSHKTCLQVRNTSYFTFQLLEFPQAPHKMLLWTVLYLHFFIETTLCQALSSFHQFLIACYWSTYICFRLALISSGKEKYAGIDPNDSLFIFMWGG